MKTRLSIFFTVGCLALSAGTSHAFTLTERPAYNDYTNAVSMGTWCGKAVEERGIAVGDNTAFLPKVSSQQGVVINVKQKIQSKYPSYIKPGITDVPGVLNTFGADGLKWSNDVAFLTYCGRATNCFISTPYFALQVPASSNGWYSVKGCLTNMTHSLGISMNTATNYYQGYSDFVEYTNTWAKSKLESEGDWRSMDSPSTSECGVHSVGYYQDYDGTIGFFSVIWNLSCYIGYSLAPTNFCKTSTIYAECGTTDESWNTNDLILFDPQGSTAANGWSVVGTVSATNASVHIGCLLGNDIQGSTPAFPSWCDQPSTIDPGNDYLNFSYKGWELQTTIVVFDWASSPNGFQYK